MNRRQLKTDFSTFLNKTSFEDGVLTITGKKWVTSALLFLFLMGCLWCVTLDMPSIIKVGVVLSALVLGYGLLDVLFSKNTFTFDVRQQHIKLHRKSLRNNVVYDGPAKDYLTVTKKTESSSDGGVPSYFVILVFDNNDFKIPYQLIRFSMTEANADEKVHEWRGKLGLG